jgi:Bardet-Biedl syndrome 4 protein
VSSSVASNVSSARKPTRSQQRVRVNWLIYLLYSRGELEECMRLIESQLDSCGGLSEYPVYVKGLVLRQQGRVGEALEQLQRAVVLNPCNAENLKEVGRCLFLLGKHRAALDVLDESAVHVSGEDWEVSHHKGLCFMYLKELDHAVAALEESLLVQRHDVSYVELARVLTAQDKVDKALGCILEALEFSPHSSELLTACGLLYLRSGESFKAFDMLGSALTHDPRSAKAILAAGSVIQDNGEMDVALVKYRVAAVRTPNSAQLWNNIGMCFFGKQRLVAAAACLKRSLYLDPFQWITAYNLGLVHLRTAQYASAFHYLSASINLKPDFAHAYMHLAIALARLDDPDNAVAAYRRALQLDPDSALCRLNFAATLLNLALVSESKLEWEHAKPLLAGDSSSEAAKEADAQCANLIAQLADVHDQHNASNR